MKIEITTNSDYMECETCGGNWATSGTVHINGEMIIDIPASAHCFGGTNFNEDELLVMALHKLGHSVCVDGAKYHVTCHNDDYHGPMEAK